MRTLPLVTLSALALLAACTPSGPGGSGSSSSSSSSSVAALSSSATSASAMIQVDNPLSDQTVASPLVVTGRARGPWFFEASFPVKLLDASGNVLSQGIAQAQGEWMTEEFVPFVAQMPAFTATAGTTGTLVLEKDNPSGMPENAASVEIPVNF